MTIRELAAVCLQFPEGGTLHDVGKGPGILVDQTPPDHYCDFFTLDAGRSYDTNPPGDPMDWGFEVLLEPDVPVAVARLSWTEMKRLYGGTSRRVLYQSP